MSNDYSPDADDQVPEKKNSQQLLLLLLLLLVVLFGYLYFFTGVIKPRGEQPKPQPVAEAPVKTPLPPRPAAKGAEPSQPAAPPVAESEEHKGGTPAAQPARPGAPAKEAAAAGKSGPGKEAAAAKHAAGAKEAPVKPVAVAPAAGVTPAKPAAPAAPGKGAAPSKEAKGAPAAKNAAQAKALEKPAVGAKAPAVAAAKPKAAARPALYTLEINGDLAESEIAPVLAKLKKAGITRVVKSKTHKGEPMHRLYLADFANRDEAVEELDRLKFVAPSAFMLKEGGRYAVYAGSYLRDTKAAAEQSRLQAKGVQLLLKSATAPVEVLRVRAGAFADQASADRAAKAAKKAGLSPKVVRLAKEEK